MKPFSPKTLLWTLFLSTSVICAFISYLYFPAAFPIIHLNLTMNRTEAVAAGQQVAIQHNLGPADAHVATSFATDEKVKTFVELEAGGKEALIAMMDAHLYEPYLWQVRLFKPFEQREVIIGFTPDGSPYGFKERLSENEMRENISVTQAQKKAEAFIQHAPWNILLSHYTLVETSQDTTPHGRIDHTFVYERNDATIGEGTYRLSVVVSGDQISELNHFIKIPQKFTQRYQEMRSQNANIAYIGTLLMILLYGMGGCVWGFFYLLQRRALAYKAALYWATGIACGVALTIVNKLPLAWMTYNTSFAPTNFLLQIALSVIITFIMMAILFALIFMTAEGLTRVAFPDKIQFWRLFNPAVARSYSVLGYTIGGYLLVPFCLAYVIIFYLFTTNWFGWWIPSSALFEPNILATYFPWLESVALSLQAGFFEECLFRAIPLAAAALLGERFGKKKWWILGAFIVQAAIFGAAHANYPAQPAYARLIELFVFSFVLGGVYLRFGLLPSIIAHFGYDVFLFALPVLVSTAEGARVNQIIIALLSFSPLWIVLWTRLKNGAWYTLPQQFLNRAWQPGPPAPATTPPVSPTVHTPFTLSARLRTFLLALGIVSFGAWLATTRFQSDAPPITNTRQEVMQKADFLMKELTQDPAQWTVMTSVMTDFTTVPSLTKQHRFIWQEEKPWYQQLIGSYLAPPHWIVRYARFSGSLDERAVEYIFYFNPDGSLMRLVYKIPETAESKSLSRTEALERAQQEIQKQYSLSPDVLKEISARSEKQPNRLDWVVVYKDLTAAALPQGETRISVSLAGDEIVDSYRFVHVPEEWERKEENNLLFASIISSGCHLLLYLLIAFGAFWILRNWGSFHITTSFILLGGIAALLLFELFNAYPSIVFKFVTSQPFAHQLFRSYGITIILLMIRAGILAIFISFVTGIPQRYALMRTRILPFIGISIGTFFAALLSLLSFLFPSVAPTWAFYTPLLFLSPFAMTIINVLLKYLTLTLLFLFGLIAIQSIALFQRKKAIGIILFFALACITAGILYADNLPLLIAAGIGMGSAFSFFYYQFLQYNYAVIPLATAAFIVCSQLQQLAFNSFHNAILMQASAILVILFSAGIWYKKLLHTSSLKVK